MKLNHPIKGALLIAALYLLAGMVFKELRQHELLSPDGALRSMGVLMGLVIVVSANAIPKRLVPLARLSCEPARDLTLRRIGAWALVLGGLGYTLAYALAPIGIASTLAIGLLSPAVLVVLALIARCAWKHRQAG
jgi:hypothetical protein